MLEYKYYKNMFQ